MNSRFASCLRVQAVILAAALLIGLGFIVFSRGRTASSTQTPAHPTDASEPAAAASAPGPAASTPAVSKSAIQKEPPPAQAVPPDRALLARFTTFHAQLRAGLPAEDVLKILADLKKQVHDLPPEVAAATLVALLKSGEDASTGLAFVVGPEGVMDESPTYRTALLDLLGQTDPEVTEAYSRSLLKETDRPDEFALALRNLAWLDHENALTPEISARFAAMLDNDAWRTAPSAGYLEAFDVAVAVGGAGMIGELSSVLRLSNSERDAGASSVNRAAFIALDRIMLREPETFVALFAADPQFLDFAPNHRASLLARLDPASPTQQAALRTYLVSLPPESKELAYFAKLFPNGNFFEGNRLVTSWETTSTKVTGAERDRAAATFVDTLLSDPSASSIAPVLTTLRNRLAAFNAGSAKTSEQSPR